MAVDNAGNVYIADYSNFRVRKVDTTGIITTVVGHGQSGLANDGGLPTLAELQPVRLAPGCRRQFVYIRLPRQPYSQSDIRGHPARSFIECLFDVFCR